MCKKDRKKERVKSRLPYQAGARGVCVWAVAQCALIVHIPSVGRSFRATSSVVGEQVA